MITKLGSPQWIANQYRFNTGGIDVKGLAKMNEEKFKALQPQYPSNTIQNPGVVVSISDQARQLFEAMQENMQKVK